MFSTKWAFNFWRTSAGTSSQSLRFWSGRMTCFKPDRAAARTFSLMPPTRRTRPRKLISPVMAISERTCAAGQQRGQRGHDGQARAGAVLGRGAGGDVDVDVALVVIARDQCFRAAGAVAQEAQGGLGAFLHHFAQRAGQDQSAFAGHARGFDKENFPAHGRPSQADGDAVFGDALGRFGSEGRRAEVTGQRWPG